MSDRKLITAIEYPGPNVSEAAGREATGPPSRGGRSPGGPRKVARGRDAQHQAHAAVAAGLVRATSEGDAPAPPPATSTPPAPARRSNPATPRPPAAEEKE